MPYEGTFTPTESGKAVFGEVHFTGPLGQKNKIKIDISLIEKMVKQPISKNVTTSYQDLSPFAVTVYSLDEILAEKIRSMIQRSKVRDYYDVWRMLTEDGFNRKHIGQLVLEKCNINKIEYDPAKISDQERLDGLTSHWYSELGRLVEELPEPNQVFSEISKLINFLPKS